MTDRDLDLLRAAGRAAGITLQLALGFTESDRELFTTDGQLWNPLTDDGDALRLAVKLRLSVDCMEGGRVFVGYGPCLNNRLQRAHEVAEFSGAECDARRAIVRAAAAMEPKP